MKKNQFSYILSPENYIRLIEIACGDKEGKPFYIQGPFEDEAMTKMIVNRLEKNEEMGNFHFLMAADNFMDDDDWDDEDDEDWDDEDRI